MDQQQEYRDSGHDRDDGTSNIRTPVSRSLDTDPFYEDEEEGGVSGRILVRNPLAPIKTQNRLSGPAPVPPPVQPPQSQDAPAPVPQPRSASLAQRFLLQDSTKESPELLVNPSRPSPGPIPVPDIHQWQNKQEVRFVQAPPPRTLPHSLMDMDIEPEPVQRALQRQQPQPLLDWKERSHVYGQLGEQDQDFDYKLRPGPNQLHQQPRDFPHEDEIMYTSDRGGNLHFTGKNRGGGGGEIDRDPVSISRNPQPQQKCIPSIWDLRPEIDERESRPMPLMSMVDTAAAWGGGYGRDSGRGGSSYDDPYAAPPPPPLPMGRGGSDRDRDENPNRISRNPINIDGRNPDDRDRGRGSGSGSFKGRTGGGGGGANRRGKGRFLI